MQRIKLEQGFTINDFPQGKEVHLRKGELFLYEGDKHHGNCFLIVKGRLEVRLISGSGHETLLYHLEAGELVGELAMFGVKVRIATVVASAESQLLEINDADFSCLLESYDFLRKLTKLFIDRYVRTHDVVCRLGQPNIGSKLCRYFLSLSEQMNHEDHEIKLNLPSHSEMGKLVSCQRETITREMKKLAHQGVIKPLEGKVYALNTERMRLVLADMLDA